MSTSSRGQIITFYSYKGGTGRTMALANVACILAERQANAGGKGVLMIDWDLEAPGLHRYFRSRVAGRRPGPRAPEDPLATRPGLIDLFYELDQKLAGHDALKGEQSVKPDGRMLGSERLARTAIKSLDLQSYIIPTTVKGLSLIKAGRFNPKDPDEYPQRVNSFNWAALYKKSPHLIRVFAEMLAEDYAFVLIDSRTGVTDISGICTTLLPEKLVVVFTPNRQSLRGGLEQIRRATDYRKESGDLRPLLTFPLVSRVEANEPDLRHDWRFGNSQHDALGYQPEFESLLKDIYDKEKISLEKYFDEIQIQHIPHYAYGEEVAVLVEKTGDKFSLRRSYQTFAIKLAESRAPWDGEIKGVDSSEGKASKLQVLTNLLLDALGSRAVRRNIRTALLTALILTVAAAAALSYYWFRQERQKAALLERQLKKEPHNLSGKIEQVESVQSPGQETQILIRLSIRNYGPPTKVGQYSLHIIHAYSRSFEFKGPPTEISEPITLTPAGAAQTIVVAPQDSLMKITEQELGTNAEVTGWIRFTLPLPLDDNILRNRGMRYYISFNDLGGGTYEASYEV